MLGAGSIGVVFAGLWMLSPDVRERVALALADDPSRQLYDVVFRVQTFGHVFLRAVSDYRDANAPLVGFGIVAVVLAILMFKT
jgi:hypothetical protein